MIDEIKRLHAKGFSLLWLQPRSKKPIEIGWTKGPRQKINDLITKYQKGMNLGVRLGSTSVVSGYYLGAIDCDVKSTEKKHLKEMEAELTRMGLPADSPTVISGRGNGSRHHYVVSKVALRPKKWAQSKEVVPVHMPSATPSTKEKETLSPKDIKSGMRLRAAWEISIMGEGQQAVLPPSIHPDSGKPYQWRSPLGEPSEIPLIDHALFGVDAHTSHSHEFNEYRKNLYGTFERQEIDLKAKGVPQATIALIEDGDGCGGDKSTSAYWAAVDMVKCGLTDDEICSVLTDRTTYLGEMPFRHTKSGSIARAAYWIRTQIVKKAREQNDPILEFEGEIKETPKLSEEKAKEQEKELKEDEGWESRLDRTQNDGRPRNTFHNIELILKNAVGEKLFVKNTFVNRDSYGLDTPWGRKKGDPLSDVCLVNIKSWLVKAYRIETQTNLILEVVKQIASENSFHPVRDYLDRLTWDGKPRINTWLKTHLGATAPEPYLTEVSRKTLCAMIARVYQPGVKFDHMLILEGKQGVGKSSVCRILASQEWFSDTSVDINSKDGMLNLQGAWVVEISELMAMKKVESEAYKSFFSRSVDRVRSPYNRMWEDYPRQCIFIGSTNESSYLKDKSGNRRFWPVEIDHCDQASLRRDRNQLFAEAKWVWELTGEPLYLDLPESAEQALEYQERRVGDDEETVMLGELLEFEEKQKERIVTERFNFERFSMTSLFEFGGPWVDWTSNSRKFVLGGNILRRAGFGKTNLKRNIWSKLRDKGVKNGQK